MLAGFCSAPARAQSSVYDWTGFYAGVHAGGAWGKTKGTDDTFSVIPDIISQKQQGGFGGGQFGYQQQFGRVVWGSEFSASYGSVRGSNDCFVNAASILNPGETLNCKSKQDWTLLFLNRLGYAFGDGRLLSYLSGGIVLSQLGVTKRFDDGILPETWTSRQFQYGAGLGAGFQYALGQGYFFGVEYFYTRFFNQDYSSIGDCGCTALTNQGLSEQSLRVSLNYTFGNPPSQRAPASDRAAAGIYDWTGFYVGLNAGAEEAKKNGAYSLFLAKTSQSFNGGLAGLQFGYNHQFDRVVLGAEFSGSWNGANGDKSCVVGDVGGPPPDEISCKVKQNWNALFLTRLGYAFDDGRLLPYVVGGVALTQLQSQFSAEFGGGALVLQSGERKNMVGGVLGAGLQYALGNGLSVGVEYLYTRYGNADFSGIATINGVPVGVAVDQSDLTNHAVRVVANYKFNDVPMLSNGRTNASVYNWTGFYAGLNLGQDWSRAVGSDQAASPLGDITTQKFAGQFGGGQLGYNHQFGRIVFGGEFSVSLGNMRNSSDCFQTASLAAGSGVDFNCRIKEDWSGRYLTRLGYAFEDGRLLPYVLGGIGLANVKVNREFTDSTVFPSESAQWGQSKILAGAVFGAGLQYALGNNLSFGAEYLYTRYGMQQFTPHTTGDFFVPSFPATFTQDMSSQSVRFVLNYKFDGTAPGR